MFVAATYRHRRLAKCRLNSGVHTSHGVRPSLTLDTLPADDGCQHFSLQHVNFFQLSVGKGGGCQDQKPEHIQSSLTVAAVGLSCLALRLVGAGALRPLSLLAERYAVGALFFHTQGFVVFYALSVKVIFLELLQIKGS